MDINKLLNELTIKEKCSLLVGKDGWHTMNIDRLNIPSVFMADGPHGLRKSSDDGSVHDEIDISVCYPSLVTLASSFNPEMAYLMGNSIAKDFKAKGVNLILGPGINIKRHPFCGRNFEYFSEDPLVTTKMAKGFIEGAKKENVGVCLKHYALNSQEDYRMTSNSIADDRAKYEIYYKSFQELVKLDPEMVMCSYNKVDGIYASENIYHLKTVLREQFGFNGVIVSDWSAVDSRTKALIASLDLEMPGHIYSVKKLIKDYKKGKVSLEVIDDSVKRILEFVQKFEGFETKPSDLNKHHHITSEIAKESIVLLKNKDNILPLSEEDHVLVIGDMAEHVRYQGGGSSHINAYQIDSALESLSRHKNINYLKGYHSKSYYNDSELIEQLKQAAPKADKIVIFCGLTDEFESEGYDRTTLSLPNNQLYVINQVTQLNPNTVIVLELGSPIVMPFQKNVKGILNCYLGGEGLGLAIEQILYGKCNPSGRLAETFPESHSDIPSNPFYMTGNHNIFYQESIYVGYRYFSSANKQVLYPFGYGKSYSHFSYSNMTLNKKSIKSENTSVSVSVDITNNGPLDGKEVCMLFFENKIPNIPRPIRELIDFKKVFIKNGETKTVTFNVSSNQFEYYHPELKKFVTDDGLYHLQICKNARDIFVEQPIEVHIGSEYTHSVWNKLDSYKPLKGLEFNNDDYELLINQPIKAQNIVHSRPFTINNNLEDMQHTKFGRFLMKKLLKVALEKGEKIDPQFEKVIEIGIKQMPLRSLAIMSDGQLSIHTAKALVALVNNQYFKAIKYFLGRD